MVDGEAREGISYKVGNTFPQSAQKLLVGSCKLDITWLNDL